MPHDVLIGRDATVYTVQRGGIDLQSTGVAPAPGYSYNYFGKWKSIRVRVTRDWEEVTPSSGELKEKRRSTYDWNATLESQVRRDGSSGLVAVMGDDYLIVNFTEADTGAKITLIGGISDGEYARDKGEAKETLNIENTGPYNGGSSMFYNGAPV